MTDAKHAEAVAKLPGTVYFMGPGVIHLRNNWFEDRGELISFLRWMAREYWLPEAENVIDVIERPDRYGSEYQQYVALSLTGQLDGGSLEPESSKGMAIAYNDSRVGKDGEAVATVHVTVPNGDEFDCDIKDDVGAEETAEKIVRDWWIEHANGLNTVGFGIRWE